MPRDGHRPTETDILIAGSFNLGFAGFAAGAEVDQLLDWWSERLATDCLVAPERGYFVDQRWMDLAPGLIPSLAILRDAGYNVAYWNLSSRDVRRQADSYTVNGRPCASFTSPAMTRTTRIVCPSTRIASTWPPSPRCGSSATATARLWPARGTRTGAHGLTPGGRLPDGTPLDAAARAAFRDGIQAGVLDDAGDLHRTGGPAPLSTTSARPRRTGRRSGCQ